MKASKGHVWICLCVAASLGGWDGPDNIFQILHDNQTFLWAQPPRMGKKHQFQNLSAKKTEEKKSDIQ